MTPETAWCDASPKTHFLQSSSSRSGGPSRQDCEVQKEGAIHGKTEDVPFIHL